jgi:predicted O-methyltransferase YrrM
MEYFFRLQRKNNNYEIINKDINNKYLDHNITKTYNDTTSSILLSKNKDIIYVRDRYNKINVNNQYYLWYLIDFDIDNSYKLVSRDFNSDFYINKILNHGNDIEYVGKITEIKDKYKNILYNYPGKTLFDKIENLDLCKREDLLFKTKLKMILFLFDFLEYGGTFFLSIHGFCNDNVIELYYILAYMFEYCIIYNSTYIVCKKFKPVLKKEDFEKMIDKSFSIEPKFQLNELLYYITNNLKYHITKNKLLLGNKEDEFLDYIKNEILNSAKSLDVEHFNEILINYNISLIDNFKKIYVNNKLIKTSSAINGTEGHQIIDIIKNNNFKKCLEIGMAYGVSAFYILSNKNTKLVSIDPFQETQWNNNGINLLKEFKFNERHKLYKLKSFVALPKLLKIKGENFFDFIFIDGFHTFDYTLIDFFYSNLLLRIGGIIIIDDALHQGVSKCVNYIIKNYAFYKKLKSSPTIAVFIKTKEDDRDWNFHSNF